MNHTEPAKDGEKNNGRFKAGVSGNPAGRPKADKNIRELARQYTEEALDILVAVARNPKASNTARVHASCAILDRGWGKPSMFIESVQIGITYADYLDHNYSVHAVEIEEAYVQLTDKHQEIAMQVDGQHYEQGSQTSDIEVESNLIKSDNLGDL